ncbi:hypothetical protein K1X76_06465 [bacterium]|nr:hypothetical protein [bacterium]
MTPFQRNIFYGAVAGALFGTVDVGMDKEGVPEWAQSWIFGVFGGMLIATAPADLLVLPVAVPAHEMGERAGEWVGETGVVQETQHAIGFDLTPNQWGTLGGSTAEGAMFASAAQVAHGTGAYQWLDSTRVAQGVRSGAQGIIDGVTSSLGRVWAGLIGTPLIMIGNPDAVLNNDYQPGVPHMKQG